MTTSYCTASPRQGISPRAFKAVLMAAALLLALPAWSQSSSGSSSGGSSAQGGGTRSQSQPSAGRSSQVSDEEREMVDDLAHASLAEIETGRLALEKSQNTQVRAFAQQMIDDHGAALKEMQQLAQKKQLTLPTETDFQHKAIATGLRALSGELFDKQYIRQVGVNDHRRTVDLLLKMQQTARDPELKAHAGKMLPIVQRHLGMARDMDKQMK